MQIRNIKKNKILMKSSRTAVVRTAVLLLIVLLISSIYCSGCKQDNEDIAITISIIGDIMLSRGVNEYMEHYGYDYPYENVKDIFIKDDLTIANLECVLTGTTDTPFPNKQYRFAAAPENAAALKNAGIDCVSLANNHSYDYCDDGLLSTINYLNKNSIEYIGISGRQEYIININGVAIGILAYCLFPPEADFGSEDSMKVIYLDDNNLSQIDIDMEKLDCDFTIVYFHWGNEYQEYISTVQEKYAKYAIDAGADFIVGTHPHVLQPYEVYNGKHVYYSLGNFIFDRQVQRGTDETIILQLIIDKTGLKQIKELPYKIKNSQVVNK